MCQRPVNQEGSSFQDRDLEAPQGRLLPGGPLKGRLRKIHPWGTAKVLGGVNTLLLLYLGSSERLIKKKEILEGALNSHEWTELKHSFPHAI